ncbi:MAG: ornithine cyclodeaminase family protein [Burkholderiales bacterium]|nr:ornithine cyclodeaminase family protein [Burkholderiales bacterium]
MVRYLKEKEVEGLLTMPLALEMVERSLRDRALGRAVDVPRARAHIPAGTLHMMSAGAPELGLIGYKAYYATDKGTRYFVQLFGTESGKLEAILEASCLGMVRTGAASGVATKYLAREDASVAGMIGAGKQAVGQLEAVCAVRGIRAAKVWSRDPERVRKFCETMSARLGIEARPAESAADAVRGTHVVNVITKAAAPVLTGELLEPGQHINAAGSNSLIRRELDEAAVRRCAAIAADSRGTARNECGDLLPLVEKGYLDWNTLAELGEIITGRAPGRQADTDVTLYESHGMAVQDVYVAAGALRLARERGVGVDLPIGG